MEKKRMSSRPGFPISLRTALIYVLAGFLWILFSDLILESILTDLAELSTFQTFKGWFFILTTGIILYFLLRRYTFKIHQAEEQFRKTVEAVKDYAIIKLNPDGNILTWNRGAERLLKYKSAEIIGKPYSVFFKEEDKTKQIPQTELKYVEENGKLTSEGERIKKNGEVFYAIVTTTVLRNNKNELEGFLKIMHDISERKKDEEQILENREQIRALLGHIESVRDEERVNISREIHDELGQVLTAIKMDLAALSRMTNADISPLLEQISGMNDKIDRSIAAVRKIASDLRPSEIDLLGLEAAIESKIASINEKSGLRMSFSSGIGNFPTTNKKTAISVYRIFQEAVTNILRHSGATKAEVLIYLQDKNFVLEISDNGRGFENKASSKTLGLIGMKERSIMLGGKLSLISSPGSGSRVLLIFPAEKFN